jgi:hypothetical protein
MQAILRFVVARDVSGALGSRVSIHSQVRRSRASAHSLHWHSMPPWITEESRRPRVSNKTMVGTFANRFACQLRKWMAFAQRSRWITLARKELQSRQNLRRGGVGLVVKRQSLRDGRALSLDNPFHKTWERGTSRRFAQECPEGNSGKYKQGETTWHSTKTTSN